jgi:OOP family OmpA-OmpF porin
MAVALPAQAQCSGMRRIWGHRLSLISSHLNALRSLAQDWGAALVGWPPEILVESGAKILLENRVRILKKLPAVLIPLAAATLVAGPAFAEEGELAAPETASATTSSSGSSSSGSFSSIVERIRVGGFLGGNYLSSKNELGNSYHADQVPGSGFLLGIRASYLVLDSLAPDTSLNPQLSAELEAKFTISSTDGNASRESISTPVMGWRANLVLDMLPDRKVVPFALVGIGGETVFGENKFMTSPDTDFATYLGGGVRYPLADQIDLRGDLRLGFTAAREQAISVLGELHVGVSYAFGKPSPKKIVSGDPEPDSTPKKIVDEDGDGIADENDSCPKLPEVFNGIDDKDGCPEVDSDGDGLVGSLDTCPAAAEDMDGFKDEDGCPEPDNDEDGRPDVIDKCPSEPENLNGFEDDDGCPDEIPAQLAEFTGTMQGIEFKTASARILRRSRKTLNSALTVMTENPSVRIEISGHTDNQGSDKGNRSLSRKRADYVKWYLVDKGIAADRIGTKGHGPDKPVATNETRDGRQKNRRIEFRLLPGAATVEAPKDAKPASTPPTPAPEPITTPAASKTKPAKKARTGKAKAKAKTKTKASKPPKASKVVKPKATPAAPTATPTP